MTRLLAVCLVGTLSLALFSCQSCEDYVSLGGELTKCRDGHIQVKFAPGQEMYYLGDDPENALALEIQKVSNHRSQDRIEVWVRVQNRTDQEIRFDRYEIELDYQGRLISADEVGVNKEPKLRLFPNQSTEQRWIFQVALPPESGVYPMVLQNVRTHLNGDEDPIGVLIAQVKVPGLAGSRPAVVTDTDPVEEAQSDPPAGEEEDASEDDYWGVSGETGNATNPIDQ